MLLPFLQTWEPIFHWGMKPRVVKLKQNQFKVELTDGRLQEITIQNFKHTERKTEVWMREFKNGKLIREKGAK